MCPEMPAAGSMSRSARSTSMLINSWDCQWSMASAASFGSRWPRRPARRGAMRSKKCVSNPRSVEAGDLTEQLQHQGGARAWCPDDQKDRLLAILRARGRRVHIRPARCVRVRSRCVRVQSRCVRVWPLAEGTRDSELMPISMARSGSRGWPRAASVATWTSGCAGTRPRAAGTLHATWVITDADGSRERHAGREDIVGGRRSARPSAGARAGSRVLAAGLPVLHGVAPSAPTSRGPYRRGRHLGRPRRGGVRASPRSWERDRPDGGDRGDGAGEPGGSPRRQTR